VLCRVVLCGSAAAGQGCDRSASIDRSIKTAAYPPHHMGSPRFCFFNTNNKQPLKLAVKPVGTPARCDAGWACIQSGERNNRLSGTARGAADPCIEKARRWWIFYLFRLARALPDSVNTKQAPNVFLQRPRAFFGSIPPVTRYPSGLLNASGTSSL
jgi:hypothetical protein